MDAHMLKELNANKYSEYILALCPSNNKERYLQCEKKISCKMNTNPWLTREDGDISPTW
jgi:hypothetical protein